MSAKSIILAVLGIFTMASILDLQPPSPLTSRPVLRQNTPDCELLFAMGPNFDAVTRSCCEDYAWNQDGLKEKDFNSNEQDEEAFVKSHESAEEEGEFRKWFTTPKTRRDEATTMSIEDICDGDSHVDLFDCDYANCVGLEQNFLIDTDTLNKPYLIQFIRNHTKDDARYKMYHQCVERDYSNYGPRPEICLFLKFEYCVNVVTTTVCENWSDDNRCDMYKMVKDNCFY